MPRPLGVLLIALLSLLFGVYAWFGLIWLLSAAARLTKARGLEIAMLIVAPHAAGWLVALAFGVIAFVLVLWFGRKRRLARLGSRPESAVDRTFDKRPAE
jgi:Flp pilus assembly protein TadB